ncbi:ATP-binding cassette domain-containing protein [Mycobacterium sp. KBS0706]|uniref:ABC transporter ATP-binding protein n=1 Tax=Mycobacterium sp. KBS0706 TaxID=2578109 RepID=UPI00110FC03D|nr:oligopeptide/dipeptide ABC transporter ATP-binding protein [Mycobacterium sp. KBS0706]TSD85719.1 ATP-binding cassette domain-containing protein [Mycobacterium sp. KBS0706]
MTEPLLVLDHVVKRFGRPPDAVQAVDGVSLTVAPGEVLGLVGESGSGKSTLGRLAARLADPDAGTIRFAGQDVTRRQGRALGPLRAQIQLVFQDPVASLNPRDTIGTAVEDPLRVARVGRAERRDRVAWLLDRVGLGHGFADRYPHELSGGQRQRVAIARALAPRPRLVICDEPVSALDVSVRAQVLDLLAELGAELGLAYLFISHDLAVVRHVADRVAVMHLGRIVESGPTGRVWSQPGHPYTRALLSAVPRLHPVPGAQRMLLQGDPPSPRRPPSGCRFRTRCPLAFDRCALEDPPPVDLGAGQQAACLIAGEGS